MKISIIGHFGMGIELLNGQTIKTNNLVEGIEKYTNIEIVKIDTYKWIKHPVRLLQSIRQGFCESEAVIMLPAQNGVRVFSPVLLYYKKKHHKKIFYDVIGGWLPEFLLYKRILLKKLKAFDGIWVETQTMKKKLETQGFENISVLPNFKELKPLKKEELIYSKESPLKLCTFSRVMREKGIGTAVQVIQKVNKQLGYVAFSLDIYGQIWEESKIWFEQIRKEFPEYICYKGCVDANKSVEILQNYFALLFSTHFYTEGIPGTLIDAYAAGIPVISAKWESYADVVDEGKTGLGYQFDHMEEFEKILLRVAENPQIMLDMKMNCIEKSQSYIPKTVIKMMLECFGI